MCHICGEVKKFLYFAIVIGFICPFLETGRFLRSSSTLPKIKIPIRVHHAFHRKFQRQTRLYPDHSLCRLFMGDGLFLSRHG